MTQLLPQNNTLYIDNADPIDAVNSINSYIEKYSCENMSVDISLMNIIDSCYVSTLCSTKHYIKYPQGKIKWKISSELIKEFNESLELGNCEYSL